jgi:hypothetical protein
MKIIFLDIDGVLNNYNTKMDLRWEPSLVEILNRIVKETEAKAVLSSTWRQIEHHRNIIKNDMKINFIDVTPKTFKTRGHEIQTWLDYNPFVDKFVILDDDADMDHLKSYLLQTDPEIGLTNKIADMAIRRLNG